MVFPDDDDGGFDDDLDKLVESSVSAIFSVLFPVLFSLSIYIFHFGFILFVLSTFKTRKEKICYLIINFTIL